MLIINTVYWRQSFWMNFKRWSISYMNFIFLYTSSKSSWFGFSSITSNSFFCLCDIDSLSCFFILSLFGSVKSVNLVSFSLSSEVPVPDFSDISDLSDSPGALSGVCELSLFFKFNLSFFFWTLTVPFLLRVSFDAE